MGHVIIDSINAILSPVAIFNNNSLFLTIYGAFCLYIYGRPTNSGYLYEFRKINLVKFGIDPE